MVSYAFSNMRVGSERWKRIVLVDARGYYAYSPAVFIFEDLNFTFYQRIEKPDIHNTGHVYNYSGPINGKWINKYYGGTALCQTPFFLAAHAYTLATGGVADGYTAPYMYSVGVAAIFYFFLGLFFLAKIMEDYGVRLWPTVVTLLVAGFGTNLYAYTVLEGGMSHVYSFAFVSLFVYAARRYLTRLDSGYLILMGAALGMIVFIRPVNLLVVLFLPFLAERPPVLITGLRRLFSNPLHFAAALVIMLALPFIQLVMYKVATGNFIIYSYTTETFNFLEPHIIDILFSYKKGLFLYTPLYLVGLLALAVFWRWSRFAVITWLGAFFIVTWVFSSWWMWYYGGSFSSRVYVEFIPLFMIPLGVWLTRLRRRVVKVTVYCALFVLIGICQVQTYQYRWTEIHWSDMTKERYWDVFLMHKHWLKRW